MTIKLSEIHPHLKTSLQYLNFIENKEDDIEIDEKYNVENFDVNSFENVINKIEVFTFWGFSGIPDSILEFMIENPNSGVWKYLEGKYQYTQFNQKASLSNRIKRLTKPHKYREQLFFESIVDGFLDLVKYLYNKDYNFQEYIGYCTNMEVIEYLNIKMSNKINIQLIMMVAAEQNNIIILEFYMKKMDNFFPSTIQYHAAKSYSIEAMIFLANNKFEGSYKAAASIGRKDLILQFYNDNIADEESFFPEAIISNSLEIFQIALDIGGNQHDLSDFIYYLDDKSKLPFIEKYSNSTDFKWSCQFEDACLYSPIEIVEFMYLNDWDINDYDEKYSNAAKNDPKIFEFLISKNIPMNENNIWDTLVDLRDINMIKLALNNFTMKISKSALLKCITFDDEDIFILLFENFTSFEYKDIFEKIINLNAVKIFQLMLNKTNLNNIDETFLIITTLINNNITMYELLISFVEINNSYCIKLHKLTTIGMLSSFETIKYLNENQKFVKWNYLLIGAFIKQRLDIINFLIKNYNNYKNHCYLWHAAIHSNIYESLEILYNCGIKWENHIFKELNNQSKNKLFSKFLIDKKII